ncbi:serine hydrolase domain-containing protein [Streptomyces sp. NPDC060031]|uniref:serine hydrolase domain-containing protein n=1 Tax=Streptomyces sp. NPDC060031 TaxID=3347043 RepID=UPI0036ADD191
MAAGAPGNYHSLSVALVCEDTVSFAGIGTGHPGSPPPATEDIAFEIGSITKALTGMLLCSLAEQGTVSVDQPVAELLPDYAFASTTAQATTLEELASHRSGLPRLHRRSVLAALRDAYTLQTGGDPYRGMDREDFLRRATTAAPAGPRGEFLYSNLGMSLLGHALAAGGNYPALLHRQLLAPLEMNHTRFCTRLNELPKSRALPHRRSGKTAEPWLSEGYTPSGTGAWSTARDLARLLRAVLDERTPGMEATRPRFAADGPNRIGMGWMTLTRDGREVTWHNGGTAGSRSFLGIDRQGRRAVVVLSNTDHDVDTLGARLLLEAD